MKTFSKKLKWAVVASMVITLVVVVCLVVWRTKNRVQIEFNIHINKEAIYLSTYAEPPQFAIWLEDIASGRVEPVFVTYRVGSGDWEGKADVPVATPYWTTVFAAESQSATDAVSGATPKEDFFRIRVEVRPGTEWICRIEMNLAGDYNEFYPQFDVATMMEDEYSCGQPALLYEANVRATKGNEYVPRLAAMSFWESGANRLIEPDATITTAQHIFDEIIIRVIEPKPMLINLKKIGI